MDASPAAPQTPLQRFAVEQALILAKEMEQAANDAAPGQALQLCESVVTQQGQALLRRLLGAILQKQVEDLEKKGPHCVPVRADTQGGTKAVTAVPS